MTYEVGRICVKTAGRETAKKAVILGFIDNSFVLVTGAGVSGVRRRKSNIKHLVLTNDKIEIKENSDDKEVLKALEKTLSNLRLHRLFSIILHKEELLELWDKGLSDILSQFVNSIHLLAMK